MSSVARRSVQSTPDFFQEARRWRSSALSVAGAAALAGGRLAEAESRGRQALDLAREDQRHLQQVVVGILDLLDVLDQAAPAAKNFSRIAQRRVERLLGAGGENHLLHQLAHLLAGLAAA